MNREPGPVGPDADLDGHTVAGLHALLARADLWEEPPAGLVDPVVEAIVAEASSPLARTRHRVPTRWWLAAAAVVLVIAGAALITGPDPAEPGTEIALVGTDLAPEARGTATVRSTPAGLVITIDTTGLPGAPEDSFYEGWVTDGDTRFSAGTFHLRGGASPIVLWAGVDDPAFRTLTVTLEPADGVTDSSGEIVLVGDFRTLDD